MIDKLFDLIDDSHTLKEFKIGENVLEIVKNDTEYTIELYTTKKGNLLDFTFYYLKYNLNHELIEAYSKFGMLPYVKHDMKKEAKCIVNIINIVNNYAKMIINDIN